MSVKQFLDYFGLDDYLIWNAHQLHDVHVCSTFDVCIQYTHGIVPIVLCSVTPRQYFMHIKRAVDLIKGLIFWTLSII